MAFENGVNWKPLAPEERGRHSTFGKAVDAALGGLLTQKNAFFDSLADRWPALFPGLPLRPGRYEDGRIYLYVPNAPARFMMQSRLPTVRRRLAELPDAPKKIDLRLEIRAS